MNGGGAVGVKKSAGWAPRTGCLDEGEIYRMMGAEEQNMKERIWFSRMEYSVLNKKMKENECGQSDGLFQ
jgi:hypothetical protein